MSQRATLRYALLVLFSFTTAFGAIPPAGVLGGRIPTTAAQPPAMSPLLGRPAAMPPSPVRHEGRPQSLPPRSSVHRVSLLKTVVISVAAALVTGFVVHHEMTKSKEVLNVASARTVLSP